MGGPESRQQIATSAVLNTGIITALINDDPRMVPSEIINWR